MFVFSLFTLFLISDFPICTAENDQFYPSVNFVNNQYYVFWEDRRFYGTDTTFSVFASRVTTDGTVLDPQGKEIFSNLVYYDVNASFDGSNFLVALEDSC